jgi:hypothetical protein
MEAIEKTINDVMLSLEAKQKVEDDPGNLFNRLLTRQERQHARFAYFKKGVVNVEVDSSAWLYRLSLKKEEFLQKFGRKSQAIKDIRFRLGEIK